MKYETISIKLIEQKSDESIPAFIQRVNRELEEFQKRDEVASVIPFPTQSIGGLFAYHLMIMTRVPRPMPRTDANFHCGDETDGGPGDRCKEQCSDCKGDKIIKV